jgi:histidinol-phosphate aminotransferase|eukprot:COSAG02_NODE_1084_length_14692_cov_214.338724_4_plen_175_part_00
MRTFSKAYGLAGARVGYAIAHADLANAFDKIRNHFGLSRISQAGALAALEDHDWLKEVVQKVEAGRRRIEAIAVANGLRPLRSATNFVTIDCGRGGNFARALLAELLECDVFVRMPAMTPADRCVRVGVGTEKELAHFEEVLPRALLAATKATTSAAGVAGEGSGPGQQCQSKL